MVSSSLLELSKFKALTSRQILDLDCEVLRVLAFCFFRIVVKAERKPGFISKVRLEFSELPGEILPLSHICFLLQAITIFLVEVRKKLASYDTRVLDLYLNYLKAYVQVHKDKLHPEKLPGSNFEFPSVFTPNYVTAEDTPITGNDVFLILITEI
jgi:hypothetical protein